MQDFTGAIFKLSFLLFHDLPVPFLLSQSSTSFLTILKSSCPYSFSSILSMSLLFILLSTSRLQVNLVTAIFLLVLAPLSPVFLAELYGMMPSIVHHTHTPNLLFAQQFRLAKILNGPSSQADLVKTEFIKSIKRLLKFSVVHLLQAVYILDKIFINLLYPTWFSASSFSALMTNFIIMAMCPS